MLLPNGGTFDLTENTQFAVRFDTLLFPQQQSFHIFACPDTDVATVKPFQMEYNDAVEWDRQVQLAHWILEMDEKYVPKEEAKE